MSKEERQYLFDADCFGSPLYTRVVILANLPVVLIWGGIADLTYDKRVDQAWLFYLFNGIGIPLFWFGIGWLFDQRRLVRRASVPIAPLNRD
jgi:hypothetical protein